MTENTAPVKLSKLFTTSFLVSSFIIGSGHVALPMFRKKFVQDLKLLSEEEITDILVIAQCTPGAVAVNMAVAIGYKLAAFSGVAAMVVGTLLPPLVLIIIIQRFYSLFVGNPIVLALFKGMNAAVAAVMLDVIVTMLADIKSRKLVSYLLVIATFILGYFFKVSVAYLVIGGILLALLLSWRAKK